MFTEKDLHQIEQHGLTREAVERQIENFRRGFPFLKVVRAASPGDGVVVVDDAAADAAQARYEQAAHGLSVVKFVPASGAATRMFKELFEFVNEGKRGKGIDTLLENIERFAFWPELKAVLPEGADDRTVVSCIVKQGLGYGQKPKGLVTFHAYADGARKAVEEHLVEGAAYASTDGVARIHFTVSPEHRADFESLLAEKVPVYEKRFGIRYEISFSVQKPSTDTIAVNPDNTPFRQEDGSLLFRPAGHGAPGAGRRRRSGRRGIRCRVRRGTRCVPESRRPAAHPPQQVSSSRSPPHHSPLPGQIHPFTLCQFTMQAGNWQAPCSKKPRQLRGCPSCRGVFPVYLMSSSGGTSSWSETYLPFFLRWRTHSVSRYSICPFTERKSSSAQAARAS